MTCVCCLGNSCYVILGVQYNNSFSRRKLGRLSLNRGLNEERIFPLTADKMRFSITMLSTEQPAQGNLCNNAAKQYMLSTAFVKPFPLLRVNVSVFKMACSSTTFPDGNVKSVTYFLLQNILLGLLTSNWLHQGENLLSRNLRNSDCSIIILPHWNKEVKQGDNNHKIKC